MISTLTDILRLVDDYTAYLQSAGCRFDGEGFPLIPSSCFLDKLPDKVIPYRDRKSRLVTDPSKTVLCFYCEDARIYPRLERVFDELPEYRKFMGVVAADVTVTPDMEMEWQRELMLLNQLFMAVLAANGIKVVLNLRCGSSSTLSCFDSVPSGVMCASGTLGCAPTESPLDMTYLVKLLRVRPSAVLLYGKPDPIMEDQLALAGIPYRRYDDFHQLSKKGSVHSRTGR